jgi:hypothetical protein
MVTHEPELAVYTRRIITLRDGELVSDKPVTERRSALDDLAKWKKDHALLAGEELASVRPAAESPNRAGNAIKAAGLLIAAEAVK